MAAYKKYVQRKRNFIKPLLKGLMDSSEVIRKKMFEFWDNELSKSTLNRLMELFTMLHDWSCEGFWLSYAIPLLLASTSRSIFKK